MTFLKPAILLIACVLAAIPARAAEPFTFAALGDTPYNADEEMRFVGLIAELNREPLAFAVHVGDFKAGNTECTDEVFLQRREWFGLSRHPFIFVPGDNEWIDCRRAWGRVFEPRERLARLREIFFSAPGSLGQRTLALERQSAPGYPEHARWIHGNVVFATLNVPGGDNNFSRDRDEHKARDRAVREWVAQAFAIARERALGGVVLMMQANPWAAVGPRRAGFAPLIETLTEESLRFPGAVLLVHGDTHRYRVDQPLFYPDRRARVANFTRVEVFGSPAQNWVRIRVVPAGARVRFEATPGS